MISILIKMKQTSTKRVSKISQKLIISFIALIFLFVISMQFISAEIIWSQPTGVPFTIINGQNNTLPLTISILSPIEKTYHTKQIPLVVKTNKLALCSYSVDNGMQTLFKINSDKEFTKNLILKNGNHTIKISCKTDSEFKSAQINFKVNHITRIQNNSALEQDLIYEREINTPKLSDWVCVNSKFQRTVTFRGLEDIEYGGVCGVIQPLKSESKPTSLIWLFPIIFLILILIILIAMIIIAARKQFL